MKKKRRDEKKKERKERKERKNENAEPEGVVHVVEGIVEGTIALYPKGDNGFGYDPIFYLPDVGKTMAELTAQEKNAISHRSRAAKSAKVVLEPLVPSKGRGGG